MTTPIVLDFFAGLGGASWAFTTPDYDLRRFDNNPLLKDVEHMEMIDLHEHKIAMAVRPELCIFAPPCLEFSTAYSAPASVAKRDGTPFAPDMSLLEASLEHIERLAPKYWVIENVIGSIPFFSPYLGAPTQIIGPFVLWHNCPHIVLQKHHLQAIRVHKKSNDKTSTHPLRANHKARWPATLSDALRRAIEQPNLLRWTVEEDECYE